MLAMVEAEVSPPIQPSVLFLVLFLVGAFSPVEKTKKKAENALFNF